MLFYQAAFKHERFKLAVGEDDIEIVDILDHFAYLEAVVMLRAEILADAVFERLCLADIYYLRAAVFIRYTPGVSGSCMAFLRSSLIFGFILSPALEYIC